MRQTTAAAMPDLLLPTTNVAGTFDHVQTFSHVMNSSGKKGTATCAATNTVTGTAMGAAVWGAVDAAAAGASFGK